MAFDDTWNTAYEGIPADNENTNLGANRIRDLKRNVRERGNIDHSWGDALDNGQHNQVTLNTASTDPTPSVAGSGQVYTKTVSGNVELFWKDGSGRVLQLTAIGALNFQAFASGTQMVFYQPSPPSGWTQVGINDGLLRAVNNNTGGTGGGSWTISGTSVSTGIGSLAASSGFSGSVSGTVASHTLVVTEIPSHTHNFTANQSFLQSGGNQQVVNSGNGWIASAPTGTTDSGTGGNQGHTHGWSGSVSGSVSTTLSGTPTAAFSNDGTWRPAYYNVLVASKN